MAESLNFRAPRPRHHWTNYQKQVLCLLKKCYSNHWEHLAKIFNYIFSRELKRNGYFYGMPARVIVSQWHTLRDKRFPVFTQIDSLSFPIKEHDLIRTITKAAHGLGIVLIEANISRRTPVTERETPLAQPRAATNVLLPVSPPITPSPHSAQLLAQPEIKPRLLFRYWSGKSSGVNSVSYFCAGLWEAQPEVIPPPDSDRRVLHALAKTHLSRYDIKSPFISLYDTPLAPFHRALQVEDGMLTIFDISSFDDRRIFAAVDILKNDPLSRQISRRSYRGYSEFLIWGDIPAEYIVGSIRAHDLLALPAQHRKLLQISTIKSFRYNQRPLKSRLRSRQTPVDRMTGYLLGNIFCKIKLPEKVAAELAVKIAKGWRFKTDKANGYLLFLQGVTAAYHSSRVSAERFQRPVKLSVVRGSRIDRSDDWEMVNSSDDNDWETVDRLQEHDYGVTRSRSGIAVSANHAGEEDDFTRDRARVRRIIGF
ncbi:hypothetical protein PRK78_005138 [Emydomyces testavorans]|uniref:DUF7587 domain-containing protein n=1 Tax=Emydomyces testavorans TaxID=2070801 RepID=A0AAF0DJX6_9EURO|nr:hypothetical protein PRK78_005138 [Emydomyces testavorans]